jgi:hypothetical protein
MSEQKPNLLQRLDEIPISTLALAALLLGLAPLFPEPHLWQKLKMLVVGELVRPLDIFDLLMHSTPSLLLVIRLARLGKSKNEETAA